MKSIRFASSVFAMLFAGAALAGGGPYPLPAIPQSDFVKSRAEVKAELREAQRLGLVTTGEEDVRTPTPREAQMIAEAGRRAAENERIAAESKRAE
jgi:hypothetical protein